MINRVLLTIIIGFMLIPTAEAFNPPPSSTLLIPGHENTWCPPPPPTDPICNPPPPPPPVSQSLEIKLPPRLIMNPDELVIADDARFVFDNNGHYFRRLPGGGHEKYRVSTTIDKDNTPGAFYILTVTGFERDDLPEIKNFRLTFKEPISKENIEAVGNYLTNNTVDTAELTDPSCTPGTVKSHLCLHTITSINIYEAHEEAHLKQTIAVKGTYVPGNVAARGEISGFTLGPKSLAVGGTINISGGKHLENYLNSHGDEQSILNWGSVGPKISGIVENNKDTAGPSDLNEAFNGPIWQLNSKDRNNPADSATSFSSPPEGRLWNVVVPQGNKFTIGNGGQTTFKGSGTIVFRGNPNQKINLEFNGLVKCDASTRLAFITEGDITFKSIQPSGEIKVECGSYTSLDGSINFTSVGNKPKFGNLNGIFIAKNNVILPNIDDLTGPFIIQRDDTFAANPTVLLREILKLAFTPS